MNYNLSELAAIINAEVKGTTHITLISINKIFYDSRSIIDPINGVFIAIKGIHDGHMYMEDAYQKSIRVFICSSIEYRHDNAVYLIVENTLDALHKWASHHLSLFKIPTVGITGSNGKTIVKEWLHQCIGEQYNIVRSPKSFNSKIGLPLSVLQTTEKNNLGIFEVGISQPGEMEKQEEIIHPAIGVLTNIGAAHSEYFNNREEQISEKLILFKESKTIVYNNELEEVEKQIRNKYSNKKLISFGTNTADVYLINKITAIEASQLTISIFGNIANFTIPFTDNASVQNILCLTTILHTLGFSTSFMQEKYLQLQSVSMRLELVKGVSDNLLINDTFNSDYKSLEIALDFLFKQNKNNKVLILSDILQSSLTDKELYTKVSILVNSYSLHQVLLIGDHLHKYSHLFSGNILSFNTTQEAIKYLGLYSFKDSAILLKGARVYELEKITTHLEAQTHDTIMEVNLHALMMNLNYFKNLLKPDTKVIAMVKASSYGAGGFEVAEVLQYYHTDYLAVAYADEGALLREKGIYLPIIVMNPEISSYEMVIEKNLQPEIYSFRELNKFIKKLKEKSVSEKYPIHIKIDTGMHRLGFQPEEAVQLAKLLKDNPFVRVKSIFSHFAASDDLNEKDFTKLQAERLQQTHSTISNSIGYKPMLHISNTAGIVNYPEYQFDAVRIGIGMYGYIEDKETLKKLETVITVKTVISNLHYLKAGETVGYNRRFKTEKESVIATLPIGYADGIRRAIGNGIGHVVINGYKAPIVGSICMDMLMIDVTGIPCNEGDTVIIIGNSPSLTEYAQWYNTIPYEVLTSISSRVKRVYYRE